MDFKKTLLALCLIMCVLFTVSSVAAGDVNDTAIASDDQIVIIKQTTDENAISSLEENEDFVGENNGSTNLVGDAQKDATENSENDYAYGSNSSENMSTVILTSPVTTTYNGNGYLVATLKDCDGNVLSGFDLSIYIGDSFETQTTDSDGQVKVSTDGLTPNTYDVTIAFAGSENYTESNATTQVVVNMLSTKLSANAVTTSYLSVKNLVITLKDSQGKALPGVRILFRDNGWPKIYKTNANGQVILDVSVWTPDTYTPVISFDGNNIYKASSTTTKITVKKATPKIIAKAKSFKKSVKTKKYSITFAGPKHQYYDDALADHIVTLKVNKKTFKALTDVKGVATFKITKLNKKGKYTAIITFKGTKYHNQLTKKVIITVK